MNGKQSDPVLLSYGVPQGSVRGPVEYIMYTKPLGDIIRDHGLGYHFYADDTQLYIAFRPQDSESQEAALHRVEACIADIQKWMCRNRLKLNDDKTVVMLFSSKHNITFKEGINVRIGESIITPTLQVQNLGVTYDMTMTMDQHVNGMCRSAYAHLRNIAQIRRYLTINAATQFGDIMYRLL